MAPPLEIPGTPADGLCVHCKTPIPADAGSARFCCHGCEAVHSLLMEQGLGRYYDLADRKLGPVSAPSEGARSYTWLEPLLQNATSAPGEVCSLQLDVQGIHCAACVWLMNETFRRRTPHGSVTVNPTLGTVALSWARDGLDVPGWVKELEAFGYQFGPPRKQASKRSLDLPIRLGVCASLTMNVMLFSLSFYFGLTTRDAEVFQLFTWLSFLLSSVSVVVGGWPFFQAALRGLRSGLLHLDLPIALGIVLVYGMSVVQLFTSKLRGDLAYFDTLNTFITLMLLGRFLQERMLERNRRFLLDDDGAEGLVVRRVVGPRLELVRAPQVKAEDVLLVAPGDLVPVDAVLLEEKAQVSCDWITGEAAPREVARGQQVPAGSFNAGRSAFHVHARTDFQDSPLVALLRAPSPREGRQAKAHQLWTAVAKRWVVTVLGVASLGLVLWLPKGVDQAVNVMVSVLVVTCPCAVGLAIPLAYELVQTRLRRAGFYVRSADLLDRLVEVRQVVFDKTGTLTLGRLELAEVPALEQPALDVAFNLAARSSHPVSSAVSRALEGQARYDLTAEVREHPGKGIEWARADGTWRLGRGDWAVTGSSERVTCLSRDGLLVAAFPTREALRTDARSELARLSNAGYRLWLLSGDQQARVDALARTLAFEPSQALGALSPEEKAERLRQLGADTALYLGDGVNDALAFEQALAAGTPAIDRPVMPSRSDFFLVGEGLLGLHEALARSLQLRGAVKRILAISIAYNVLAIAASLLGYMSPLAAAISMPASTLSLLLITVATLGAKPSAADARQGSVTQFSRLAGVTR